MSRQSILPTEYLSGVRDDPAFAGLVGVSWLLLVLARAVIKVASMRRIAGHLGARGEETPADEVPIGSHGRIRRIRGAIRIAAPLTPTTSNCYPQALTAHTLLRASRLPSTFYYGAAFRPDEQGLQTHAWVRCGPFVVTGAPEHRYFSPVASFAYRPRSGRASRSRSAQG
jgi:hypothetical protein